MSADAAIEIQGARRVYGQGDGAVRALDDVTLTVRKGDVFTPPGPSGCGKTTLLRLIAGVETPTAGRITIGGQDVTIVPPNHRPVNTVVQSCALFPHMSVRQNIAFGLEMPGRPRTGVAEAVARMIALVRLHQMADRKPGQLSGGQQQRVALARALAPQLPVPDLTLDPQALQGARIGWPGNRGDALPFEEGILSTLEGALRQMEDLGATVDRVAAPPDRNAVWDSCTTLRSWAIASRFARVWSNPDQRAALKPEMVWEIERGRALTGLEMDHASGTGSALRLAVAKLFESFDTLAIPSPRVWPFAVEWRWPEDIAGTGMDTYCRWMEVVILVSLAGLPAVAVPAGFGPQGLPSGLTLLGPTGADKRILSLAERRHSATDWPGVRPPLV